jgi:hypothetical protein
MLIYQFCLLLVPGTFIQKKGSYKCKPMRKQTEEDKKTYLIAIRKKGSAIGNSFDLFNRMGQSVIDVT